MADRSRPVPVGNSSTGLPRLRRSELYARLNGIAGELTYWKALTQPGARFERHGSQVERLATVVGTPIAAFQTEFAAVAEDAGLLARAEELEKNVLALHSIWEVFRGKLLLREDGLFKDVLPAFDDLAWACYRPAMERFAAVRKEPPLVYFNALWSPFAQGRDTSFQNEVRSSGALLQDEVFLEILQSLPVPLIGIPWYHAAHIPGAIVIAHEVGHVVERDFGLTPAIRATLDGAGLNQPAAWASWATEVFADVYGCLGMGSAFAGAMMDLLASGVAEVQAEKPNPKGKYPTRIMRVELMLEVLKAIGLDGEAARLDAIWEATYGPRAIPEDYRADVAKAVAALLRGPYPSVAGSGIALSEVLRFPVDFPAKAQEAADWAARGSATELRREQYRDPRLLFAAARHLHENPPARLPAGVDPYALLLAAIVAKGVGESKARGPGSRGEPAPAAGTGPKALTPEVEAADRALGLGLLDLISKRAGPA